MPAKRLLDLFCGAGGAAVGYYRAGFDEIVGVDIKPMPRFPFLFIQANALEYVAAHGDEFDVIHASPPCQRYCALKTMPNLRRDHPDLIAPVRGALNTTHRPYIIENVFGAPLENPIMLCGSFFGLSGGGYSLRRHRYFEISPTMGPHSRSCAHKSPTVGIYGCKVRDIAREKQHYSKPRETRGSPDGIVLPQSFGFDAMGIDWMNMKELSEAIPPAYTEWIGGQLLAR